MAGWEKATAALRVEGQALLDDLLKGAFADVVARFDDKLRAKLTTDQLTQKWQALIEITGPLQSCEVSQVYGNDEFWAVDIWCKLRTTVVARTAKRRGCGGRQFLKCTADVTISSKPNAPVREAAARITRR